MGKDILKYYEILGLDEDASGEEIKIAYRDLVKVWHPDRFTHDPRVQKMAEGKLKEINRAYEEVRSFARKESSQQAPTRDDFNGHSSSSEEANAQRFIFSDLTALDKTTKRSWTRNAHLAGKDLSWKRANDFINKINNDKYAGYDNWRLPTIEELHSLGNYEYLRKLHGFVNIFNYAKGDGYIWSMPTKEELHSLKTCEKWIFNEKGFYNVPLEYSYYWTSEIKKFFYLAWSFDMSRLEPTTFVKNVNLQVWPVRNHE